MACNGRAYSEWEFPVDDTTMFLVRVPNQAAVSTAGLRQFIADQVQHVRDVPSVTELLASKLVFQRIQFREADKSMVWVYPITRSADVVVNLRNLDLTNTAAVEGFIAKKLAAASAAVDPSQFHSIQLRLYGTLPRGDGTEELRIIRDRPGAPSEFQRKLCVPDLKLFAALGGLGAVRATTGGRPGARSRSRGGRAKKGTSSGLRQRPKSRQRSRSGSRVPSTRRCAAVLASGRRCRRGAKPRGKLCAVHGRH